MSFACDGIERPNLDHLVQHVGQQAAYHPIAKLNPQKPGQDQQTARDEQGVVLRLEPVLQAVKQAYQMQDSLFRLLSSSREKLGYTWRELWIILNRPSAIAIIAVAL
jgi:hypothetical protein